MILCLLLEFRITSDCVPKASQILERGAKHVLECIPNFGWISLLVGSVVI